MKQIYIIQQEVCYYAMNSSRCISRSEIILPKFYETREDAEAKIAEDKHALLAQLSNCKERGVGIEGPDFTTRWRIVELAHA